MKNNKNNIDLLVQFLYYLACGFFAYALVHGLFSLGMEAANLVHKNRLGILEFEYKIRSLANFAAQAAQAPSQVNGWQSWIKPIVIYLGTLSLKYLFSLACSLLPKAFYKITLLGPVVKLIVEGPEGFLSDNLTPGEIKEKFEILARTGDNAFHTVASETAKLNDVVTKTAMEVDRINLELNNRRTPATVDCQDAINRVAASIRSQEINYRPVEPSAVVIRSGSDVFSS